MNFKTNKNINKLILISMLSSTTLMAENSVMDSIGANIGYAYMPYNYSGTKPDGEYKKGLANLELYAMFKSPFPDNTYRPVVSYVLGLNGQFTNSTLLLGMNKYFIFKQKAIYVGPLVGYGQHNWRETVIGNTTKNDLYARSFVGGLQGGVEFYTGEHFSFNINTKFLMHSYEMQIQDTPTYKADYTHPYTASISLGLKYSFDSDYVERRVNTYKEREEEITPVIDVEPELEPTQVPIVEEVIEPEIIEPVKEVIEEEKSESIAIAPVMIPASDSDNDGIFDTDDKCSNTPEGFDVDENGCEKLFTLNIKFAYKSNEIPAEYYSEIRKLVIFLENRHEYSASINAYTDNIGGEKYNIKLSKKRAKAVYQRLRDYGIEKERLEYIGLGETNPIASNDTYEGREKNRRVEVRLVNETQSEEAPLKEAIVEKIAQPIVAPVVLGVNEKCLDTSEGFSIDKKGCEKILTLNIKFANESSEIPSEYSKEIRGLVVFLENNQGYTAAVNAHTDDIGGEKYNIEISKRRAKAIYQRLIDYGIKKKRLEYLGLGATNPISSNETSDGREKNRRVEVILTKGTQYEN